MFTGIVRERGRVVGQPEPSGLGGVTLVLAHSEDLGDDLPVGGSLSVAGVCLTITQRNGSSSMVEVSPETLARTTLGELAEGSEVNLEPPLKAGDPLGGHWVQGHVDTTVEVVEVRKLDEHSEARFSLPEGLVPFVVEKGSVTVDGASLTVSRLGEDWFEVALIPHTLEVTTLGTLRPGSRTNLEIDILAKYVHQVLLTSGRVEE